MMPHEETLTAKEMLEQVQRLKDLGVQALFGQLPENEVLAVINGFMHAHRMQILDLLDDLLYEKRQKGEL